MSSGLPDQSDKSDADVGHGNVLSRAQALFNRALGKTPAADGCEFGDREVGRLLCATRMRLGKDLQQIAQVLHIRYTYLVAMEDGRYEDLPGQAYAIGFVRAYADHLELDGDEIVRRFKEDSTGLKRKAALDFSIPTPDSGVPSGVALLAAIMLGIVVYGIWYGFSGTGRQTTAAVQEVPTRLLPPPDQPATPADGAAPATAAATAPSPPEATPPEPAPASPPSDAANPAAAQPPGAAPIPVATAPTAPAAAPTPAPGPSGDVIEVRAKADSWIQVRDGDTIILTRLLRKGESYTVPDRPGLTLMTANAGGIEILLNGEVTAPLGDVGAVASGVALDGEHLKGGD